jgi:hypothetical protein
MSDTNLIGHWLFGLEPLIEPVEPANLSTDLGHNVGVVYLANEPTFGKE